MTVTRVDTPANLRRFVHAALAEGKTKDDVFGMLRKRDVEPRNAAGALALSLYPAVRRKVSAANALLALVMSVLVALSCAVVLAGRDMLAPPLLAAAAVDVFITVLFIFPVLRFYGPVYRPLAMLAALSLFRRVPHLASGGPADVAAAALLVAVILLALVVGLTAFPYMGVGGIRRDIEGNPLYSTPEQDALAEQSRDTARHSPHTGPGDNAWPAFLGLIVVIALGAALGSFALQWYRSRPVTPRRPVREAPVKHDRKDWSPLGEPVEPRTAEHHTPVADTIPQPAGRLPRAFFGTAWWFDDSTFDGAIVFHPDSASPDCGTYTRVYDNYCSLRFFGVRGPFTYSDRTLEMNEEGSTVIWTLDTNRSMPGDRYVFEQRIDNGPAAELFVEPFSRHIDTAASPDPRPSMDALPQCLPYCHCVTLVPNAAGLIERGEDLGDYFNQAGLDAYRRGDIVRSARHFSCAASIDREHALAAYNRACVLTLLRADADRCDETFLQMIEHSLAASIKLDPARRERALEDRDLRGIHDRGFYKLLTWADPADKAGLLAHIGTWHGPRPGVYPSARITFRSDSTAEVATFVISGDEPGWVASAAAVTCEGDSLHVTYTSDSPRRLDGVVRVTVDEGIITAAEVRCSDGYTYTPDEDDCGA